MRLGDCLILKYLNSKVYNICSFYMYYNLYFIRIYLNVRELVFKVILVLFLSFDNVDYVFFDKVVLLF